MKGGGASESGTIVLHKTAHARCDCCCFVAFTVHREKAQKLSTDRVAQYHLETPS